jgi:hypothetical protein
MIGISVARRAWVVLGIVAIAIATWLAAPAAWHGLSAGWNVLISAAVWLGHTI